MRKNVMKRLLFVSALAMCLLAGMNGTVPAQQVQVRVGGGARITAVYLGWPATHCRTRDGRPAYLERGDIIVGVDGKAIRSAAEMVQALQQSHGVVWLKVIDRNTNRRISLLCHPVRDIDGFKKIGVDAKTVALPYGPFTGEEP